MADGESVASFTYTYNDPNQRTVATLGDGSYWEYTYDTLGQVTSGKKYWSDGTPVAGQQFDYSFDDIGNRKAAGTGGGPDNTPMRYSSYSANALNQYASRTVPGFVSTLGEASTNARVTLWGDNGAYSVATRKGEYFHGELAVNNSTGAVWLTLTNLGVVRDNGGSAVDGVVGRAFVPATPEAFGYDLDGNLTNDGRWVYAWDAENRLVGMASATRVGPQQSLRFEYDWQGRRIRKRVWDNANGKGNPTNDVRFAYDGWNLIAEMNAELRPVSSFMWGLDLSGSLHGAGGVGGLLTVNDAAVAVHFASHDGNGNLAGLVGATSAASRGRRESGPFGESVCATGSIAKTTAFRFSTKYQDDETDLVYYGHRYYSAGAGRWLSRDPIQEVAGENAYRFGRGNPLGEVDIDGRLTISYLSGANWGCGGWLILWDYEYGYVSTPSYLVQKVTVIEDYMGCGGSPVSETTVWWEASTDVLLGWAPPSQDTDRHRRLLNTYSVTGVTVDVIAAVVPVTVAWDVILWGTVEGAPGMKGTSLMPGWWNDFGLSNQTRHTAATWYCCCGSEETSTLTHSP